MKVIGSKPHALLDYMLGIFLVIAPAAFGFSSIPEATAVFITVGVTVLLVSLLTDYPLGLIKVIPFPVHGFLETVGALGLLASPWLFHFSDVEIVKNLAMVTSLSYLVVIALTNYDAYQEHHLLRK